MDTHVLVALLKSIVLANVVQIVPADDNCPLHLHLLDNSREDSATNSNFARKGAFLVNVRAIDSLKPH